VRRVVTPAVLTVLGVLLTVLVTVPVALVPWLGSYARPVLVGVAWLAFAAAIPIVRRVPQRLAVRLILAGAVAMPLASALVPPTDSDDVYRYIWDGRVQAAGIDPYRYPPAATPLVPLRDPLLWPGTAPWCVTPGQQSSSGAPLTPGCTLINRPAVHTIYPPAAQAYFRFMHAISPSGFLARPFQLAGAVFAIATTLVLLGAARARGADPRSVVAWAWCPAVALEAANNAHVDALAVLLTALALLCLRHQGKNRWLAGGAGLLGLAVATKLTPLLVVPAVLRRRPAVVALTSTAVVVALYVPHVLRIGTDVVGYLPGYLTEEGYADGTRFALLTLLVPPERAAIAAAAVLVAVAVWVSRSTDADRPWLGAATMTGAALLVTTPGYQWYALLLVMLVGLGARRVWLTVVAAGYLVGFAALLHVDGTVLQRVGYGIALAVVAGTSVAIRRRRCVPMPIGPR
jgi:hypothetical protein